MISSADIGKYVTQREVKCASLILPPHFDIFALETMSFDQQKYDNISV